MGFFRFYGLVFREAFRHSPDIAQTLIFFALILAGLIAAGNPAMKEILDGLDLGGWKIAAVVFGAIIALRLIMAPYWLWKTAQARIVTQPSSAVDFQLRVVSFGNRNDKPKKIIQIVFYLRNTMPVPLSYEVESIEATVSGDRNDDASFENMGGIVPANGTNTFDYAPIQLTGKWIKPGAEGTAAITYKYGIAGGQFVRRAKFSAKLIIQRNDIRFLTLEDTEATI